MRRLEIDVSVPNGWIPYSELPVTNTNIIFNKPHKGVDVEIRFLPYFAEGVTLVTKVIPFIVATEKGLEERTEEERLQTLTPGDFYYVGGEYISDQVFAPQGYKRLHPYPSVFRVTQR